MNVDFIVVKLLSKFQRKICLNPATLRQFWNTNTVPKRARRDSAMRWLLQPLHISTDAIVVPILALCLRWGTGSFWEQSRAQGTIGVWVAFGPQPTMPVARVGHVPNLDTKRVSWCSTGQESSWRWRLAGWRGGVGSGGNVGTRLTKAFM